MLIVADDRRAIVVDKSGLSELLRTPIQRNWKEVVVVERKQL
jgi:hypothetical protein